MSTRLIIAPYFEEPDDDRAVAARACAAAAVRRGERVRVLCPHGPDPGPEFECDGLIELHRIDAPARNAPAGFAARAVERACEIAARDGAESIECCDAPWCVTLGVWARASGAHDRAVCSLRTRSADSPIDRLADRMADELRAFGAGQIHGACDVIVPVPLEPGALLMPELDGPQFVVPTRTPVPVRLFVKGAFERANSGAHGWTLACAKGMGRWMLHPGGEARSRHGIAASSPIVFIAPPTRRDDTEHAAQDPVACRIAVGCGHLCVVSDRSPLVAFVPESLRGALIYREDDTGSLAACLRAVASAAPEQRAAWSRDLRAEFHGAADSRRLADRGPSRSAVRASPAGVSMTIELWSDLERVLGELPRRAARTEAAA